MSIHTKLKCLAIGLALAMLVSCGGGGGGRTTTGQIFIQQSSSWIP